MDKFFFVLYNMFGIFLLLIIVNCVILGGLLFMVEWEYNFVESIVYGVGFGFGWVIVIVVLVGIWEKMKYSDVFFGFCGLGIIFIVVGFMVLVFMVFNGI